MKAEPAAKQSGKMRYGMNRKLPPYEVRRSSIQGFGVFAIRRIRKGTRILEYLGERITPEEADARYDDGRGSGRVILFTASSRVVIDAGVGGNDAQYINHSCEAACESVVERGRVFIEAMRTIYPGEELTYDYLLERDAEHDAAWGALYACRCGTPSCRGTMLAPQLRA